MKLNVGIMAGTNMYDFTIDVATRASRQSQGARLESRRQHCIEQGQRPRVRPWRDDTLGSGLGRDQLTGGAGLDILTFKAGQGRDAFMDFDADGGVGFQDLIGHEHDRGFRRRRCIRA